MQNKLNEIFDLRPDDYSVSSEIVPLEHDETSFDSDYDIARGNIKKLLTSGSEALIAALEVAKQSENPQAFQVVGELLKKLSEINHQLLDINTKRQKLISDKAAVNTKPEITNNNMFVGSTAELSKMLSQMKKGI